MNAVNRSALIVTHRQPYLTWANSLDDDGPKLDITSPHYEPPIYLVNEIVDESDIQTVLKRHHTTIFENELAAWHLDPAAWPERRNFRTFQEWFDVTVSTMVLDLGRGHITVEDLTP